MSSGHDLALALRSAYLAMHRRADASLAPFGVTADQFVLLSALVEAEALTQRELARRVGSDASTVRAMLLLLERRRLVTRGPHPHDGRARRVVLTPRGRQAYRQMYEGSEAFRAGLLAAVGSEEADAFLGLLRRVARVMAAPGGRTAGGGRRRARRGVTETDQNGPTTAKRGPGR
jgi:DNA-binding MarR family transcriptional regulator